MHQTDLYKPCPSVQVKSPMARDHPPYQSHHRMKSPMARDRPPYHGVRQHRWGVWISEIDHPILNVKVWLGTFDTEEKAARAYDEAARLMHGPRVQTNFPPTWNATSLLADDIRGNLRRILVEAEEATQSCRSGEVQLIRSGNREGRRGEELSMKLLREEDVDEMIKELLYDDGSIELRL